MRFINVSNSRLVFCSVVLALLLSACGSTPDKSTGGRTQKVTVPPAAQQSYERVVEAIDKQDWTTAEVLLQEMIAQYPRLLGLRASLGWVYWRGDKTEDAIQELKPLLDNRDLYKPDAFNTLAIIYREQGQFDQAKGIYEKALAIWPNDAQTHLNLGILYDLYLGQLNEALVHYRQAQRLQKKKDKRLNGWIKDLERRVQ